MGARAGGRWLIVASALFWLSWLLMPGVGITDAALILDLVSQHRNEVRLSVVLQLLSASCYAPALIGLLSHPEYGSSPSVRLGSAVLLIGAMGSAADSVFHLLALYMTDPELSQASFEPLMRLMQGPGLSFILPLVAAYFGGSLCLAWALARCGLTSRLNPMLFPAAFLVGLLGFVVPPESYRLVGLSVLLLVSVSQAWMGVGLVRTGVRADSSARSLGQRQALLVLLFVVIACDSGSLTAGPSLDCRESGVQCQLPTGPLGVCERSTCDSGKTPPCFQCTPQH